MSERTELPDGVEEEIRAIAREEAEAVTEEKVTDGEGESWSIGQLVHDVGLTRRQALLAMFYMAGGAVASTAIVQAFSASAEAAPSDDLTVPGTLTTGAVDTGQATIGTVSGQGDMSRLVDRRSLSSDTATVSFSGLSDDKEYRLFIAANTNQSGTVYLRANGDGASTGNYAYWDASGTKQTSENEFLVLSMTNGINFASSVTFTTGRYSQTGQLGFSNSLHPGFITRVDDFGREGGRNVAESLSSVELATGGVFDGGQCVFELWERDYS